MRANGNWLIWIVIVAGICLPACEPAEDAVAVALLRQAVGNNDTVMARGELKVSFSVEGTIFTPWFHAYRGVTEDGSFFALETLKGRGLIDHHSTPPLGNIHYDVRGALLPGQGALTVDRVVEIADVEAFLAVHRVTTVTDPAARTVVAGRRVVHLRGVSRHDTEALRYDIFVDEVRGYILGMTESAANGDLRHAFEYATIQYVDSLARLACPQSAVPRLKRQEVNPLEAARLAELPVARVFPQATPEGFPRRRVIDTGALDAICLEFSNGTTTGILTAFVRKPRLRDVHVRPQSELEKQAPAVYDRREVRDLILGGRAFVDGQFIGVTYRVEDFDVIELHTSEKSILVLSTVGLAPLEELIGSFPLD